MSFIILGPGEPVRVATGVVSADFFDVLGIQALHARTLEAADEAHGAEAVLVLEHGFWQRHYGGDREIVGKALEMNDRMHTVVGVLPPVPLYPEAQDVYLPTSACPIRSSEDVRTNRDVRMMNLFGRLTPGATVAVRGGGPPRAPHLDGRRRDLAHGGGGRGGHPQPRSGSGDGGGDGVLPLPAESGRRVAGDGARVD